MKARIENLMAFCAGVQFGEVPLSAEEKVFRDDWNQEILSLCKTLPQSVQTDALLFFMQHSGLSFDRPLDFFRTFYVPTWSIVYWLLEQTPPKGPLHPEDAIASKSAHSMAMFLHALDDHLHDNEMPVTHLTLLLRSQAWMIMNSSFQDLSGGIDGGRDIVFAFIDEYYDGITNAREIVSLDAYGDLFRKQMATGMIAPVLLTRKMGFDASSTRAVQSAFGSFGIAWRLLDDIKDIHKDVPKKAHSSVYVCLPEKAKALWDEAGDQNGPSRDESLERIFEAILEYKVIQTLLDRIGRELEHAAETADEAGLPGLGREFRCMWKPLESGQTDDDRREDAGHPRMG